ncbi:hypothetical protein EXIGLDRAFT_480717 [Exidia glandulosa HHB12029]|uniref:Glucose-methanol-choline oxidoreductase N-terminal domain-containing protein n=1 Tax=Exidia glandulosa HHB12029 TaxID=1314781 RepID=A0A166NGI9_EXIGL|nr:hypothetical protein EXIGLDRAFT_480717 [Exidia glandulosa HHB12029]
MQHTSTPSLHQALFPLTPKQLSSAGGEFDIIIVGSGFGGGVLAADLVEKLSKIPAASSPSPAKDPSADRPSPKRKNSSSPDRLLSSISSSPRILLIERGGVPFVTHCSNVPALALVSAHRTFKSEWAVESKDVQWQGGAVFALGGRSTVWNGRAERCVCRFK